MDPSPRFRRALIELALLAAIGVFMALLGPYGTIAIPGLRRFAYWLICIVGGGGIGIAVETWITARLPPFWPRVLATSLLMTPPTCLLVVLTGILLTDKSQGWADLALLWKVFVISVAIIAVRGLIWRAPPTLTAPPPAIEPPPPAAAVFRQRLSARRRSARLIAVEAEDHYLRVHTDAGAELLTLRFADALGELAGIPGWQTHRSWWVAADAIESVQWRRGAGDAHLATHLTAPISRTYAPALKAAGW